MSAEDFDRPERGADSRVEIARDIVVAYSTPVSILLLAGIGLGVGWMTGVVTIPVDAPPRIPRSVSRWWPFIAVGVPVLWVASGPLAESLDKDTRAVLHAVQPSSGDFADYLIPDEIRKDLTVIDKNGNELDQSRLHDVRTPSGRQAWEVQEYRPEENVAVVSFMAGFSPTDIRRYESSLDRVEAEAQIKASRYDDLVASNNLAVMQAVDDEINQLLHAFDGYINMHDNPMLSNVEGALEEYGVGQSDLEESSIDDEIGVEDPRVKYGDREAPGEDPAAYGYGDQE